MRSRARDEEEAGPAAVRRVPPGLLDALPVHALGALCIVVVVRDVGPRQVVRDDVKDAANALQYLRERAHHEDQNPLIVNGRVALCVTSIWNALNGLFCMRFHFMIMIVAWLRMPQRQGLSLTPCRRARLLWSSSAGKRGPQSSPGAWFTSSARWPRQPGALASSTPPAPNFCRGCSKELTITPWRLQKFKKHRHWPARCYVCNDKRAAVSQPADEAEPAVESKLAAPSVGGSTTEPEAETAAAPAPAPAAVPAPVPAAVLAAVLAPVPAAETEAKPEADSEAEPEAVPAAEPDVPAAALPSVGGSVLNGGSGSAGQAASRYLATRLVMLRQAVAEETAAVSATAAVEAAARRSRSAERSAERHFFVSLWPCPARVGARPGGA